MTDRASLPSASASPGRGAARGPVLAGLLTLAEALVVLGLAGFYAYEISIGATDSVTRALTSGILILGFGLFLLFMARGWSRRATWPRTPTILWNALLLPVAWSLLESEQVAIALGVGLLAVASIAAAIASPARERREAVGEGE